jgi:hypothetical protein
VTGSACSAPGALPHYTCWCSPDALELPVSLAGGVKEATVPTPSTEYLVKHWEL